MSEILEASTLDPDQNPIGSWDFLAYEPMLKNKAAHIKDITHIMIFPSI